MPSNTEALTDTYINDLIQKKIQSRNNLPQVEAAQAQSALASIRGGSPLAIAMSGLNAIGQGFTGADSRAAAQQGLDQVAAQQNFKNQQDVDRDVLNTLQQREKNQLSKQATLARIKGNDINAQKYAKQLENTEIADATRRNTAARTLEAQEQMNVLNVRRKDLGKALTSGVAANWLVQGVGGNDYQLTKPTGSGDAADIALKQQMETPEYKAFAKAFDEREDIEDSVRQLNTDWNTLRMQNESNKNKFDDFSPLDISGLATSAFKTSAKKTKEVADLNAADDATLAQEIKSLVGESGIRTTAFKDTEFSLDGSLSALAADPLDKFRNGEDTEEVNNLLNYSKGESASFNNSLSDVEQKYVLSKFLADKEGADESFWDLKNGKWSEDVVDADLPKYVENFLLSKDVAGQVGRLKSASARNKLVRQTDAKYGG